MLFAHYHFGDRGRWETGSPGGSLEGHSPLEPVIKESGSSWGTYREPGTGTDTFWPLSPSVHQPRLDAVWSRVTQLVMRQLPSITLDRHTASTCGGTNVLTFPPMPAAQHTQKVHLPIWPSL